MSRLSSLARWPSLRGLALLGGGDPLFSARPLIRQVSGQTPTPSTLTSESRVFATVDGLEVIVPGGPCRPAAFWLGGPDARGNAGDVLPEPLKVATIPHEVDDRVKLIDELASFALQALKGDEGAMAALGWLSRGELALGAQAREILKNRSFLESLLTTDNLDEFDRKATVFFASVFRDVAHKILSDPSGLPGLVKGVLWGPRKIIDLIFLEKFPSDDPEVEIVGHDTLNRADLTLSLLKAPISIPRARMASFLSITPDSRNLYERVLSAVFPHLNNTLRSRVVNLSIPEGLNFREGVDLHHFDKIVAELFVNARKFADKTKPKSVIEIRWDPVKKAVIVEDNGRGMDLGRQAFEWGVRGDHGDIPGQGLGLAIVKRRIATLGWTIDLETEVGRGSRFTITPADGDVTGDADPLTAEELLSTRGSHEFGHRADEFFQGVLRRIAILLLGGNCGRAEAIRFAKEAFEGPAKAIEDLRSLLYGAERYQTLEFLWHHGIWVHKTALRLLGDEKTVMEASPDSLVSPLQLNFPSDDFQRSLLKEIFTRSFSASRKGIAFDFQVPAGIRYDFKLSMFAISRAFAEFVEYAGKDHSGDDETAVWIRWDQKEERFEIEGRTVDLGDAQAVWKDRALSEAREKLESQGWSVELQPNDGPGGRFILRPRKGTVKV